MNREEFLRRLEALLSDISDEERAEAMAFYRSYFEDAGEGNEANILAELESPEKVAETIKKDLGMVVAVNPQSNTGSENVNGTANAGYTGNAGYTNTAGYTSANAGNSGSWNANQGSESYGTYNNVNQQSEKKDNTAVIVLVVVLAVITSPAWIGLLVGFAGGLLGLLVSIAAVTIALLATAVGLLVGAISCFATGLAATGFGLLGASLLVLALGILALIACVWVYGGLLPWAVKGIVNLVKKIVGGRKEQRVA